MAVYRTIKSLAQTYCTHICRQPGRACFETSNVKLGFVITRYYGRNLQLVILDKLPGRAGCDRAGAAVHRATGCSTCCLAPRPSEDVSLRGDETTNLLVQSSCSLFVTATTSCAVAHLVTQAGCSVLQFLQVLHSILRALMRGPV